MNTLMIYGAAGYTGRMAAERAKSAGLNLILAGRDEAKLAALSSALGAPYRVFNLDNGGAADAALADIFVLLNCAGPFMRTAQPLMSAAIRTGTHYLDIAAELDSYWLAEELDAQASAANVMLMPGGGGSVALLGSLAGRVAQRVAAPSKISIALHVCGSMSRGSAISAAENLMTDCLERVDGTLRSRSPGETRPFDFGGGPRICFPVTLPDLVTLWQATRIPNIETYVHVSGDAFSAKDPAALPPGPTADERKANRYQAAVEVVGENGKLARAVLDTVNGYTFTPMAAVEAARRVLAHELLPGFQTPMGLFGNGFAETIADTRITDIS